MWANYLKKKNPIINGNWKLIEGKLMYVYVCVLSDHIQNMDPIFMLNTGEWENAVFYLDTMYIVPSCRPIPIGIIWGYFQKYFLSVVSKRVQNLEFKSKQIKNLWLLIIGLPFHVNCSECTHFRIFKKCTSFTKDLTVHPCLKW